MNIEIIRDRIHNEDNRYAVIVQTEDGREWEVNSHGCVSHVKSRDDNHIHTEIAWGEEAKQVVIAAFATGQIDYCDCRKSACIYAKQIIREALA